VAEALGCTTTDIMAATGVEGGGALVLYSTGTEDVATGMVHRALLERDPDGIMRVVKHHRDWMSLADFMARMDEELEAHLTRTLGPPPPK
jgi:hypothetical protein